ncbi:MAG: DUF2183 domain-containing protein [Bdellovibrionaceae bacterium]|nr:DUF2183 domain-containing protein [Pseudobdellovibrionaceae bacterium]NUM59386.1 DUF2183 domain-containing protein [Pseudobdellovibrionaceae bacterium]
MKYNWLLSVALIFSFFSGSLYGHTLVISDIDDTIKNSFVLDKMEMVENTFKSDVPFKGMAELYNILKAKNPTTEFVYLSNALDFISETSHRTLLLKGHFPEGRLILRKSLTDKKHKLRVITKLILDEKPDKVILIGDNGESDVSIYDQVKKLFSDLNIIVAIHTVYNSGGSNNKGAALFVDQVPFVTAIDLSQEFLNLDLISLEHFQIFAAFYVNHLQNEKASIHGSFVLPLWVRCSDFVLKSTTVSNASEIHPLLSDYYSFLVSRCSY